MSPRIFLLWRSTDKQNNIKEFGGRNAQGASLGKIRDVPGTPGMFGPFYVEIPIQGAECPRDRLDILGRGFRATQCFSNFPIFRLIFSYFQRPERMFFYCFLFQAGGSKTPSWQAGKVAMLLAASGVLGEPLAPMHLKPDIITKIIPARPRHRTKTGTAGTVFQEPKAEPEPHLSLLRY